MNEIAAENTLLPSGIEPPPQPIALEDLLNEAASLIHLISHWIEEEEGLRTALTSGDQMMLHVGHQRVPIPKSLSPVATIRGRMAAHGAAIVCAREPVATFIEEMHEIRNSLIGDLE